VHPALSPPAHWLKDWKPQLRRLMMGMSLSKPIPLVTLFILIIGQTIIFWLLARRLRRSFPSIWDQLERPLGYERLGTRENLRDLKANLALVNFVWRQEYVELRDQKITLLVWCARIGYGLIAAIVLLPFLLAFLNTSAPG
jgi:hypothetical protein